MKQAYHIPANREEYNLLSELLLAREYSKDALSYIPNLARTLNIYKEYKPGLSALPERAKKTKFTFVEIVWIKMVFDLRSFGLDFDVIRELKDFLFSSPNRESFIKEIENKRQEIDVMLQNISAAEKEMYFKGLNKALSSDLSYQEINLSHLLTIIINCVMKKMPVDFRVYLNGRIDLHSDFPDGDLIKKEKDPDLLNKSFISISLTEIISFYLCKPIINPSLIENIFLKDELLVLEIIKNERPKSITIEFNKNNTIDLIKVKKELDLNIDQRLSEILLGNPYQEVKITTQKGTVAYCTREVKIKP